MIIRDETAKKQASPGGTHATHHAAAGGIPTGALDPRNRRCFRTATGQCQEKSTCSAHGWGGRR